MRPLIACLACLLSACALTNLSLCAIIIVCLPPISCRNTKQPPLHHCLTHPHTPLPQSPAYGHLMCAGCSTMLMYPSSAQSVACSVCQHVSAAPPPPQQQQQQQYSQQPQLAPPPAPLPLQGLGSPPPPPPPQPSHMPGAQGQGAFAVGRASGAVLVENPAGKDAQGNEVGSGVQLWVGGWKGVGWQAVWRARAPAPSFQPGLIAATCCALRLRLA